MDDRTVGRAAEDRDPLSGRVQDVLDRQLNPGVAAHGGYVDLIEVRGGMAYIQLGGGFQGCAQVDVTLDQGISVAIQSAVPEVRAVVDTTDHAAGTNRTTNPRRSRRVPGAPGSLRSPEV